MSFMRRASRPFGVVLVIGVLGLTACGSDDSGEQLPPSLDTSGTPSVPQPAVPDTSSDIDSNTSSDTSSNTDSDTNPGSDSDTGSHTDSPTGPDTNPGSDAPPAQSYQVLGTGNVGGTVVDPQPHPIDDIAIAESYPEQLMIRFTSGDPNCTAADAVATATDSTVIVTLQVGITEDALSRSCLAGDVEQTVSIALDAGLDGREVIAAEV